MKRLNTPGEVVDFLATPRPCFLFVTESKWKTVAEMVTTPHRIVGKRFDFMRNEDVLVVTNDVDR